MLAMEIVGRWRSKRSAKEKKEGFRTCGSELPRPSDVDSGCQGRISVRLPEEVATTQKCRVHAQSQYRGLARLRHKALHSNFGKKQRCCQ